MLSWAANDRNPDAVRLLLAAKASTGLFSNRMRTPLDHALRARNHEVAKVWIESGGNLSSSKRVEFLLVYAVSKALVLELICIGTDIAQVLTSSPLPSPY